MGRSSRIFASAAVCALAAAALVSAEDLAFTAAVDKTRVAAGTPVTLTLTLTGDTDGVDPPAPKFPDGFDVVGRSQSTQIAMAKGGMSRSTNLSYVLMPRAEGTFQLGPFQIKQHNAVLSTEPITMTVEKSHLPPKFVPRGPRYTL